ncbi:MAG: TIGR02757 family protein [Sulfurimonas sp.]|uniref:TIGR02757 family protein n=1 Tax=Sulfurimonas sp. TaxID=2022749 RepID=UPI002602C494|nr:TIGR02757 family protein [Sulfurimonas sp.]MCW8894508.1 TIGR02757 family protein [Sulfurimonas sp.]MCW8955154.1 TIGR02757 family protein [Sulfurimonas sp.]MCW9067769.1 TIGR02757 family protein [Sulfurimonas sp.]
MRGKNSITYIKKRLDEEVKKRNNSDEVSQEKLDPILVAHRYKDPTVSLICALFAYGNVKQIVKFLDSLDFSLLQKSDEEIKEALKNHYYRFQKSEDVIALFIALKRLNEKSSLEAVFKGGYKNTNSVIDGINEVIKALHVEYPHATQGYNFLISKITTKTKGAGALKRWMMFLRWMVRDDNIDMGLWSGIDKCDLIIPLDTHTFNVSKKLGLLSRKTYDLQAAVELTETLKTFDESDPLKYDFALYRIGQEKIDI